MRLRFLPFAGVFLLGSMCARAQKPQVSAAAVAQADLAGRTQSLNNLFDEIWQEMLRQSPLEASREGETRFDAALPDYSVAAYNERMAQDAEFVTKLAEIDTAGMAEEEIVSRDVMIHELVQAQEASQFKPWEMPVTATSGLPAELPRLAAEMQFTSAEDYEAYTSRLDKVPEAFGQITDDILLGIEAKRVPPKSTLEALLAEINAMLAMKPEESAFAAPLREFPASIAAADQANLRQEVLTAIAKQVYPAYQRFAKFLEAVYIPAGRTEEGAWALPNGDAYYAFLVKEETTTDLTAAQIHQFGESWVSRDDAAEVEMAKKLGYPAAAALRAAMAADSRLHPTSGAQLVQAYRTDLEQMSAKLPELFTAAPRMTVGVKAMPAWMEAERGEAYFEPDAQGGTLYVNTSKLAERSLADVESKVYEEALPGEGFQTYVAREQKALPAFRRRMRIPAFTEGWGLYAEQLGQDAGFFQDPYAEVARLEYDEQASAGLVVDTGIHAEHWTRQQGMDYYRAHTGMSDGEIAQAVDRMIAEPGAALAAKTGELEMLGMRAAAQKTMGARFDLRRFDEEIIGPGALPLGMLSDQVAAWMESQGSGVRAAQ